MYHVLYGYFIVIIALDAIPSFEKKTCLLVRNVLSF